VKITNSLHNLVEIKEINTEILVIYAFLILFGANILLLMHKKVAV